MCKGSTAAGGSRLLWTRRKFRLRILRELIVLTLEVITNLVMCSGRNFNTGENSNIWSMCRWTRQVRIRRKLRWIAYMIWALTKCHMPHNIYKFHLPYEFLFVIQLFERRYQRH